MTTCKRPQFRKTLYLIAALCLGALGVSGIAFSDDDDHHDHHDRDRDRWIAPRADVAPVTNATYRDECGACHMAYQPGLLPASAWAQVMAPSALADHYGDDASLSEDLVSELSAYLDANAADQSEKIRARAFSVQTAGASAAGSLPRITQTLYFLRKHDEVPARLVTDNPEVGSFSQCNACHRGAADGVYNEHQVRIPGYPSWDD